MKIRSRIATGLCALLAALTLSTVVNPNPAGAINPAQTTEAGVVILLIPCAILFLALQKYYVKGFMAGAVKG